MKRFLLVLLGFMLVGGLFITNCAPKEEVTQPTKVLKMGACLPLSGPAAGYGQPTLASVQIEVDKINARGGVKIGANTYNIELISEDDQFTSDGAKTAAEKLVSQDRVKYIFGGQETNDTLGLQLVTTPNKVITFNMAWADTTLRNPDTGQAIPYAFKSMMAPHETLRGIWGYIQKAYPEVKRVAEFSPNTDSGIYGLELDSSLVKYLGYEVVYSDYHEPGLTDFYPQLTKILATNPDIIHSTSSGVSDWGLIIKQAREMGYKGHFMQEVPIGEIILGISGAEAAEGLITIDVVSQGPNASPAYIDFKNTYTAKAGFWIPGALCLPPSLECLLQAMQKAGSVEDTDKIQNILETESFHVMDLDMRFVGKEYYGANRALGQPLLVSEIRGGKLVPVSTLSVEEQFSPWPQGVDQPNAR
jgi:branched-chain amino acid transport system substrate-binding protein